MKELRQLLHENISSGEKLNIEIGREESSIKANEFANTLADGFRKTL